MNQTAFPPIVVMGVSGCGKSTVGALLAQRLQVPFVDGDDLHPAANKEKMQSGIPLEDADRYPWLAEIGRTLGESLDSGVGMVVACSALKRRYRDLLRGHVGDLVFVHLVGDNETLGLRLAARNHAFMPPDLLASQLDALEPLEDDERQVLLDVRDSPPSLVNRVCEVLASGRALTINPAPMGAGLPQRV